jgi:hypothetical protein
MYFSELAWSGVGRYFTFLEKIGYTRPIRWNHKHMRLEINPNPQWIKWTIGSIISSFTLLILPVYFFLECILSLNYEKRFNKPQAVVLVVCFSAGLMSLPVFFHMILSGKQLVLGFNELIDLEKHVHGKLTTFLFSRFVFTE